MSLGSIDGSTRLVHNRFWACASVDRDQKEVKILLETHMSSWRDRRVPWISRTRYEVALSRALPLALAQGYATGTPRSNLLRGRGNETSLSKMRVFYPYSVGGKDAMPGA